MIGTVNIETVDGAILLLGLDRPPANAMNGVMLGQLQAALDGANEAVRAVVLIGHGGVFCAGADLKEAGPGGREPGLGAFARVIEQLAAFRAPVIAAINGPCVGGGLELALCCDLRLASTSASFTCAGVNVGLIASSYRLPRLIGTARAKHMLLTGAPVDAVTAERWGLVSEIHRPSALQSSALALARRIASRAPLSVEAAKRMADKAFDLTAAEAREAQAGEAARLIRSADHREALAAFRERRAPSFVRA